MFRVADVVATPSPEDQRYDWTRTVSVEVRRLERVSNV